MKVSDTFIGVLLALFGVAVLFAIRSYPPMHGQDVGPALFPAVLAIGFLLCGALLVKDGLKARPRAAWLVLSDNFHNVRAVTRFLLVILVLIAYLAFSRPLGFIITATLLNLILSLAFGVRPVKAVIVSVLGALLIHYLFYHLLAVPLPWGLLEPIAW